MTDPVMARLWIVAAVAYMAAAVTVGGFWAGARTGAVILVLLAAMYVWARRARKQ